MYQYILFWELIQFFLQNKIYNFCQRYNKEKWNSQLKNAVFIIIWTSYIPVIDAGDLQIIFFFKIKFSQSCVFYSINMSFLSLSPWCEWIMAHQVIQKHKRLSYRPSIAKNNRINVNPFSIRKPLSSLPANPICHFSILITCHMSDEALSHYIWSFHVDAYLRDIIFTLS